ncbi:MAG: PHP domain-containing protein [Firmicutes bacterium]|nr:PHP domain-containing protein [Bacillota bacterium]
MNNQEEWIVDFHTHTNFSDGYYPPEKVVSMAAGQGLRAIAITDHDTMDGIPEAITAGRRLGIEVVPGVEVSAIYRGEEVHLLGYYPSSRGHLPLFLKLMKRERFRRARKISDRLKQLGINLDREEILRESYPASPGRLHFARLLLKKGIVASIREAFERYLGENSTAYFPRNLYSAEKVLSILHRSAATSVLAHPGLIKSIPIEALLSLGIKGLEVFYPHHSRSEQEYFLRLAKKHRLVITGGSDFHGDPKSKISHPGYTAVGYKYLQQLKGLSGL